MPSSGAVSGAMLVDLIGTTREMRLSLSTGVREDSGRRDFDACFEGGCFGVGRRAAREAIMSGWVGGWHGGRGGGGGGGEDVQGNIKVYM